MLNNLTKEWTVKLLRIFEFKGISDNQIAHELTRLEVGQSVMGSEPAVVVSYAETRDNYWLWEGKYNNKEWTDMPRPLSAKLKLTDGQ